MTKEQLRQIQDCMGVMRDTIKIITGSEKIVVGFGVIQGELEKDNIAVGTQHGPITSDELAELNFEIIESFCRLYRDVGAEDNPLTPDQEWKKPS
jgi:hypothetical protein